MDTSRTPSPTTFILGHLMLVAWSALPAGALLMAGEERAGWLSLTLPAALAVWGAARLLRR